MAALEAKGEMTVISAGRVRQGRDTEDMIGVVNVELIEVESSVFMSFGVFGLEYTACRVEG